MRCISYYSYIKPQLRGKVYEFRRVVYRTIPTSNHNKWSTIIKGVVVVYRTIPTSNHNNSSTAQLMRSLYIVLFLHQTTTCCNNSIYSFCCISYYSYIKPQLPCLSLQLRICCISYYSYIKPQLWRGVYLKHGVVYRTIPTSNHNSLYKRPSFSQLYIVLFLHQTTTYTTLSRFFAKLYIVLFLHQTTTFCLFLNSSPRCISYYSYIKPQPECLN